MSTARTLLVTIAGRSQQTLEEELRDRRQGFDVVLTTLVDDLEDGAATVEVPEETQLLGADGVVRAALGKLRVVGGEHRVERRQLLHQPAPLVDATHALHQERLRADGDHLAAVDGLELDLEQPVVDAQKAIDGIFAGEAPHLGVDHPTIPEPQRRLPEIGGELDRSALAADLDRLQEIDDGHVRELAAELGARVLAFESLALLSLQQHRDARRDLLDVDRLGQVVVDAELEATDLVFDCLRAGQEDERNRGPAIVFLDRRAKGKAVVTGEPRVRDDEIGLCVIEKLERFLGGLGGCDRETRLA